MPLNSKTLVFKVGLGVLVSLIPFFDVCAQPAPTAPPSKPVPLTGAFLQIYDAAVPWYWPRNTENTKPKDQLINYTELIRKLRDELAMNTIVIQDLHYSTDGTAFSSLIPDAYNGSFGNPLKDILTEAKNGAKPVKVYLGLEYNQLLFDALGQSAPVNDKLTKQTTRDIALVDAIVKYTDDPKNNLKFDGWYISTEIGNFDWSGDPNRKTQFTKYIHDVADKCYQTKPQYQTKPLPIAISPYFNHANVNADSAAQMVRDLLAGSKVTTVMVQDGVGASMNSHDDVVDYFKALKKYLPKEIEIVSDVELLTAADNVASTSRILDQLSWQNELGTKNILGYDAINYLSPMPTSDAMEMTNTNRVSKGDATARAALYAALKKLVPTPAGNVGTIK